MPLYEYQCTKCGHRFEKIQKFSDKKITKCPECGGKVEQLLSAPAVQFKGSGWYVTDYAKKPSGAGPSDGGKDGGKDKESKDSKKEEKKSESSSKEATKESSSKKSEKK
jgi:putative FmdB family regulatory protein